ncbi:hypothetical protein Cni_G28999 [Canna indica]|uniref:Uncharacterized protein n=1 Tax=Canna indica TaxID=4628 RepID=A0AAQ3L4Z5_9LILI|nr:hypothetical protein Cni_G28998 [Canna indica]WOL20196.1 hypothetical protein Cni_G28999 [Canna indica]
MGRRPCCSKEGLNRGAWSAREDKILTDYVTAHGEGKWRDLPKRAGLKRCGKSCRLRWLNYLRPDIKRGNITEDEENLIIKLHSLLGNRWSLIAGRLPGRTDNEIKNYWNTNLSKKIMPQLCIRRSSKGKAEANKLPATADSSSDHEAVTRAAAEQPTFLIKTKAVRCSKVYIPSPSSPATQHEHLANNHQRSELARCNENTPSSASELQVADPACCFLEDFDMEELISGFPVDDAFLQLCVDDDVGQFTRQNDVVSTDDNGSLWFCDDDAMQDEFRGSDGCTESQIAAEVETLASLIDSEEEHRE